MLDYFSLIMFFVIKLFVLPMTGCGTSELVIDDEDVIDLIVEPFEVSGYIK